MSFRGDIGYLILAIIYVIFAASELDHMPKALLYLAAGAAYGYMYYSSATKDEPHAKHAGAQAARIPGALGW